MLGAVIGDIAGSQYKFENHRSPFFEFLNNKSFFTDETVIMCSIIEMLNSGKELTHDYISDEYRNWLLAFSERMPGAIFIRWCYFNKNEPYKSTGNQAVVRAIPVVKWCVKNNKTLDETKNLVKRFVEVTHNSPDALTASEVYTIVLYRLLTEFVGNNEDEDEAKEFLFAVITGMTDIRVTEDVARMRTKVVHNVNAMFSLKVLLTVILESDDFEQALKNVVSLGGDSDSLCTIVGAVAEAIWGVNKKNLEKLPQFFPSSNERLIEIVKSIY